MWFIDMNGKEDDSQFLRNIRIASEKSNGSKNSPGRILDSFILDLSFWGSSDCDPSRVTTKTKRKSARTASSNKKNTCVTSRVKTCKNRDRPYARSDSEESNDSLSKRVWKTAVDPSTGRTYYYDAITRKTQWHKVSQ